jgi:UDP-N-acetylglucosamine 2-epimerase (non-hydrolysing)
MQCGDDRVMVVAGTRPEAIKLAPLVVALQGSSRFQVDLCVTGQHRELLDQVLDLFELEADVDLALMEPAQGLNRLASRALAALDRVMTDRRPDWVVVQGDTTTAFTAALAAFQLEVPVAHLEAGLRSGDPINPFPEEANRRMTSCLATLHLAPTPEARQNLLSEGIDPSRVVVTGNTVIDAVQMVAERGDTSASVLPEPAPGVRRVLLTVHRRENHGEPLGRILAAVRHLASSYRGKIEFVVPVHPNPHVRGTVETNLGSVAEVVLTDSLPYDELVAIMKSSTLVLTDSGGLQEEAPGLGKPVLVMRETTERPEGVEAGVARLVGTDTWTIVEAVSELLDDDEVYRRMARSTNPYGDGHAAQRTLEAIAAFSDREPR